MKLKLAQLTFCLILISGQGCKSEQGGNPSTVSNVSNKEVIKDDFSKTLLASIPKSSFGFYYINYTTKAYEKYKATAYASVNAKGQDSLMALLSKKENNNASSYAKLLGLFSGNNPIAEVVGFTDQDKSTKQLFLGGIAKFKETTVLSTFIEEIKKADPDISEASFAQGKGYSLKLDVEKGKNPFGITDIYLLAKDSALYFATAKEKVEEISANNSPGLPDILSNKYLTNSLAKLPAEGDRLSLSFIDTDQLFDLAFTIPSLKKDDSTLALENLKKQFSGFLFSSSYAENIIWSGQLLTKEGALPNEFFDIASNSEIGELLNFVPEAPMLFVSISGKIIHASKKAALENMPKDKDKIQDDFSVLDGISRIGIVLNPASPGPSMFPVPEILVLIESKDGNQLQNTIEKLSTSSIKSSKIPVSPWTEKKMGSNTVKTLVSPFGLGVYMTALKDNITVITSTESQLSSLLLTKEKKTVFDPLLDKNQDAKDVLYTDKNVMSFYLNYPKLADMISSLDGMMKMYAPEQGQDSSETLSQEYVKNLRLLGASVARISVSKEVLESKSTVVIP